MEVLKENVCDLRKTYHQLDLRLHHRTSSHWIVHARTRQRVRVSEVVISLSRPAIVQIEVPVKMLVPKIETW
jgi:hypothetical protein